MTTDVLTPTEGRTGRIRLNRPKAIHALTTDMCSAMIEALQGWREDPEIRLVVIDHAEAPTTAPRRAPSSTRNIASTTCSSPTPSRPSPSWTG
jgi:hypothetical protein